MSISISKVERYATLAGVIIAAASLFLPWLSVEVGILSGGTSRAFSAVDLILAYGAGGGLQRSIDISGLFVRLIDIKVNNDAINMLTLAMALTVTSTALALAGFILWKKAHGLVFIASLAAFAGAWIWITYAPLVVSSSRFVRIAAQPGWGPYVMALAGLLWASTLAAVLVKK